MKALVFKNVGSIGLEEVPDASLQENTDALVTLTRSAICGTDLHLIRGTVPGMVGQHFFKHGTVLGHEGVGIVEAIGPDVKHLAIGDRVIVPSTIACGHCYYCDKKIFSQCDRSNPHGPHAGTAFFGGPITTGPFDGMQAEKVRVPFADAMLIKIPDTISDDQAILLSDILPTSYMAVENAQVQPHDTVAVFGCGPVGQLAIACLKILGVQAVFAIDCVPSRLQMAQNQGAHPINFNEKDPVTELKELTNQRGPTKVIDAVGIDAKQPTCDFFSFIKNFYQRKEFRQEVKKVAPKTCPHDGNWIPGDAPSQVLRWAVEVVAKAGTISIIGVYTPLLNYFPIGKAMGKNLTIRMGNCNHRAYFPQLLEWVERGIFNPLPFITHKLPFDQIVDAYKHFDKRDDGYIKVSLVVNEQI